MEKVKTKIAEMRSAIDKMNANKTAETALTVEMAIEILALPELAELEAELAEAWAEVAMQNAFNS